jgi:hypothetical protein
MSLSGARAVSTALGLMAMVSCGRRPVEEGPRIAVRWTGSDSGKIDARASAEWCDTLGLLEIRGLRGDTGVGIAVYPQGALRPGRYRVLRPEVADTSRPAAAVALRWFAVTSIRGFKGESGEVVLERSAAGTYSGHIEAYTRSVTDNARLTLRGTLGGLTARPARSGCVPRPAHPDSGTGAGID